MPTLFALALACAPDGVKLGGAPAEDSGEELAADSGSDTQAETGADSVGDTASDTADDTGVARGPWDACAAIDADPYDQMGGYVSPTGDADGDGLADFAVAGHFRDATVQIGLGPFPGATAGWPAATWTEPELGLTGRVVSDFDAYGDGVTDLLAFGGYDGGSAVLLLDGPLLAPHEPDPTRDLIVQGAYGSEHLWLEDGDGGWVLTVRVEEDVSRLDATRAGAPGLAQASDAAWSIEGRWPGEVMQNGRTTSGFSEVHDVGDLDGDGATDLLLLSFAVMPYDEVPDERAAAFLFLGQPTGAVSTDDADVSSVAGFPAISAAAGPDADGDGTDEVFFWGDGGILRFDGVPAVLAEDNAVGTLAHNDAPVIDARGDLDGDGVSELAVLSGEGLSAFPAAFEGNVDEGTRLAHAELDLHSPELASLAALGDADGDHADDYVVGLPFGLYGVSHDPTVCVVHSGAW